MTLPEAQHCFFNIPGAKNLQLAITYDTMGVAKIPRFGMMPTRRPHRDFSP